jgi:hypothetical protein
MRLLLLAPLLLLPACGECNTDDVAERSAQLAGNDATHCGTVGQAEPREAAFDCMRAAFESTQAAYAVIEFGEPGAAPAIGWVVDGKGVLFRVDLASEASEGAFIEASRCPEPVLGSARREFFTCVRDAETQTARVCG